MSHTAEFQAGNLVVFVSQWMERGFQFYRHQEQFNSTSSINLGSTVHATAPAFTNQGRSDRFITGAYSQSHIVKEIPNYWREATAFLAREREQQQPAGRRVFID
ncbi:hypothetical protein BU17DRAFT_65013 [Hysterangium stoloniferum]|nr:hypothetical protein BU17DRAFT_65013 [Hysterangium stoloniferum]